MTHERAEAEAIRVLKTAKCPSLSAESELTYQVGCDSGSEIHFRIVGNTAAGAFNQDWVSLDAIRKALATAPGPQEITSSHLRSLYAHRSVNTPAFLLAALKREGLVRPSSTTRRCHACADDAGFLAATKEWLAAGDAPKAEIDKSPKGKQAVAVTKHVPSEATKSDPSEINKSVPESGTKSAPSKVASSAPSKVASSVPSKVASSAPSKVASSAPPKVASGVPSKAKPAVPRTGKQKQPPKGKAR